MLIQEGQQAHRYFYRQKLQLESNLETAV